eukprot:TRINITY_DN341_c0_g1_i1.p1 TRINITY_DN341_c0_g1~~TRINITY_DN341_c0_g1_i1.p1  ORF type:complete len:2401 (-),score=1116.71 TRINITY_DN341_c0_g1_i1:178-7182(-)
MLHNVVYERQNMLYEDLFELVTENCMLVVCCIDAHFTALQVMPGRTGLYYDPMSSVLNVVSGDSYTRLCLFLLLKCGYGDGQHVQDNKNHYKGSEANATRRLIHTLWQDINSLKQGSRRLNVSMRGTSLALRAYVFMNNAGSPSEMSTQLTGNTCYFQSYLFALLCKVGVPSLTDGGAEVTFEGEARLEPAAVLVCRFLLEFFAESAGAGGGAGRALRPLTNSNFVIDFPRYRSSPYYRAVTAFLKGLGECVPDYEEQYRCVMRYFAERALLHRYGKFTLSGAMSSTLNTKWLQPVCGTDDAVYKLATCNYYKYRAANIMFGFNTNVMKGLECFSEFNALRKNQLLAFYEVLRGHLERSGAITGDASAQLPCTKFRDYYYMAQFEAGQRELVDLHHYAYLVDMCALGVPTGPDAPRLVHRVNEALAEYLFFSTQRRTDYQKILPLRDFKATKHYEYFLRTFMSVHFHHNFAALGFSTINPREKEINSLTQTSFYLVELMRNQSYRMEHEFAKECINEMARSTLRKYERRVPGEQSAKQKYSVSVKIGYGYTFSKYNTLMHFLNVIESYWQNPDLNNIQVFGKDIRTLLAVSCQKVFFDTHHCGGFYYYGVLEAQERWAETDLAVGTTVGHVVPGVAYSRYGDANHLVLTDRVYEHSHLRALLAGVFERAHGTRLKTDNAVLNLALLSLMLDFGLYEEHAALLNLPMLRRLVHREDKRELQVAVANHMHEFERRNTEDPVTRTHLEQLVFEVSYKFLVNKNFPLRSQQNQLMQQLSAEPAYQQQLLLCKINMSLCQINKSVEVDYYKVRCNGHYRTIIPHNYSKSMGDYLEQVTRRYTFAERHGVILYDDMPVFDVRAQQPEMNLYRVRFDSATSVHSMVKYIEIKNTFRSAASDGRERQRYLVFVADNALVVEVAEGRGVSIRVNKISIEVATMYFNEAVSFVPCFRYADSDDVILFASPNIHYLVDQGGQFCTDYYGMKHELIECITSEELIVDLNDEHVFKRYKLCDLVGESKTVLFAPSYLLQVPSRHELINLMDLALRIRNVSFFILVLFYLRRCSVALQFVAKEDTVKKISGPWRAAILYVLGKSENQHYDSVFSRQFFDLNAHSELPLEDFIDVLCENFTRYQRCSEDGQCQIVPTAKQKAFLRRIITADECFHFSEVGSGKTKVILPLLCQVFLSNNVDAHRHFARGGHAKDVLVVLVPEHLVPDARAQVFRYCLNLNFREEFRVYDNVFALLHDSVHLDQPRKQIFVTSFNHFKKALTYDRICEKVRPHRERVMVVVDEVDDFLDRDKLVFNICSNKSNAFDKPTLELYFETSRAAYRSEPCAEQLYAASENPSYWSQLYDKFCAIHHEIQDASRSLNKSFGIFNEKTLRHCHTNIAHDVEGYKSLIARPYESVNRAMPGSYYSDVERTIYLTYVIISEDVAKYDELFQQERKFISFEYWRAHLSHLDYDDLVYGEDRLSELVARHPTTKDGLTRFLYEIILRRMEIRDRSRSVNSIDVVFNFDSIGFTGTPFIDNYPTFAYLRSQRADRIPDMIDRSFYAYRCENLPREELEARFARFQGQNSNVFVEYVPSDFVSRSSSELAVLEHIFQRESGGPVRDRGPAAGGDGARGAQQALTDGSSCAFNFNVLVDLCGIFKRSSIHDVRDLVLRRFGPDRFHYIYHIHQSDSSDRVLSVGSDNDVQFDEEFYKFLCKKYGAGLRERVFFFVDNRNVIGKDVPFQLVYQRRYGQPMFTKSVVLAHDVDDFSKIWQAMGRSRTMNETRFCIYKSGVPEEAIVAGGGDIKTQELTRQLYVRNCDLKMAGNVSSIYQTLVSLFNLSQDSFYYRNEIVNTFLDKMEMTIARKLLRHEDQLTNGIFGSPAAVRILQQILADKFGRSTVEQVAQAPLSPETVETLVRQIVQHKFEQREPTDDIYDEFVRLLSGEQNSLMEISYTKQHQKQKQKQQNKNQDSDTMDIFNKRHQVHITIKTEDYYKYTMEPEKDLPRVALGLPIAVPIFSLSYRLGGAEHKVDIYPTLQFLYSHHIIAEYITPQVRESLDGSWHDPSGHCKQFIEYAASVQTKHSEVQAEARDVFAVGQSVGLRDLGGELDGRCGRITGRTGDGRWEVQLAESGEPVSVSVDNLRLSGSLTSSTAGHAEGHVSSEASDAMSQLSIDIHTNYIRQNPQYSLVGLSKGVYVIGMKDQFNKYDLPASPLHEYAQYAADDHGFVLFDRTEAEGGRSVDSFGPYFVEQYILMEVLSKQEVAQNVLDYYVHHKAKLQSSLETYGAVQGQGFICWRFVMNDSARNAQNEDASSGGSSESSTSSQEPSSKKRRLNKQTGLEEDYIE